MINGRPRGLGSGSHSIKNHVHWATVPWQDCRAAICIAKRYLLLINQRNAESPTRGHVTWAWGQQKFGSEAFAWVGEITKGPGYSSRLLLKNSCGWVPLCSAKNATLRKHRFCLEAFTSPTKPCACGNTLVKRVSDLFSKHKFKFSTKKLKIIWQNILFCSHYYGTVPLVYTQ